MQNATQTQTIESTRAKVRAVVNIVFALRDAIQSAGEIPSGHLYAAVMGILSLETYQWTINQLVEARVVEDRNHLLVWIGPNKHDGATNNVGFKN